MTPGYYRNHEATRAAFEDGWLRTSDLGHFDADGFLYVDDRKKEVIVTPAGVNVFPEDVEQALNREPGVRDRAVVEGQDRVYAVLLPQNSETFAPRLAVDAANRRLAPSQQIQGYDVWPFPDFPRTALLKVSRSRVRDVLPQLEAGRLQAPPTRTRETLATVRQVVAQVAGVPVERVRADAALGVDLEGTMTRTGQMNPFREGTGLFVFRLKVPVVPVKVEGLSEIWPPYRSFILRPGPATVKIGRPQWIRGGSYLNITQEIENAVRPVDPPQLLDERSVPGVVPHLTGGPVYGEDPSDLSVPQGV